MLSLHLVVYLLSINLGIGYFPDSYIYGVDSPDLKEVLPIQSPQTVRFTKKYLSQSAGDCSRQNCARVSIAYPQASSSDQALQNKINHQIREKLKEHLEYIHHYRGLSNSPEVHLRIIINDFKKQQQSRSVLPEKWDIKIDARASLVNENSYSLIIDCFVFMGGAHPNQYRKQYSFNIQTGAAIRRHG